MDNEYPEKKAAQFYVGIATENSLKNEHLISATIYLALTKIIIISTDEFCKINSCCWTSVHKRKF
jgi:hypothetical protein